MTARLTILGEAHRKSTGLTGQWLATRRAAGNVGGMGRPDATARELGRESMGLVVVRDLVDRGTAHSTIRRKVDRGEWERPHPNVVDVTLQRWTWTRRVLAAVLTAPRGTLASHTSAAALHRFPGYERRGRIELLIPRTARNRDLSVVVHSTALPANACTIDDVPCTDVARTLHGLAGLGHAKGCSRGVRAVLRRGLATPEQLLPSRLRNLPGRRLLERTVEQEASRLAHQVESVLEERWLDRLLDWDLPPFTTQHPVTVEGFSYRLDVAWGPQRVALEGDGDGFHGDLRSQDADGRRQERLQRDSWGLTRVGEADLRPGRAERVRRRIVSHLDAAGA